MREVSLDYLGKALKLYYLGKDIELFYVHNARMLHELILKVKSKLK